MGIGTHSLRPAVTSYFVLFADFFIFSFFSTRGFFLSHFVVNRGHMGKFLPPTASWNIREKILRWSAWISLSPARVPGIPNAPFVHGEALQSWQLLAGINADRSADPGSAAWSARCRRHRLRGGNRPATKTLWGRHLTGVSYVSFLTKFLQRWNELILHLRSIWSNVNG